MSKRRRIGGVTQTAGWKDRVVAREHQKRREAEQELKDREADVRAQRSVIRELEEEPVWRVVWKRLKRAFGRTSRPHAASTSTAPTTPDAA